MCLVKQQLQQQLQRLTETTQFPGFVFLRVVQRNQLREVGNQQTNDHLTGHSLGNIYTKTYHNQTTYVRVIACQVSVVV